MISKIRKLHNCIPEADPITPFVIEFVDKAILFDTANIFSVEMFSVHANKHKRCCESRK